MKILWVSNSPIGPVANILNDEYKGTSGGWIQSEYEALDKSQIEMYFMCFAPNVKKNKYIVKENKVGKLFAIGAPKLQNGILPPKKLIELIGNIIKEISPDLIQIWGTETCISNAVSRCAKEIPKVIFIQGLLGVHKRYLGGYFNKKNNKSLFKKISLYAKLKERVRSVLFTRQAEIEKETIKNCKNVIIDSDFAEAYCKSVDENVVCYYHVLKPNNIFNNFRWSYDNIVKHQIFAVYGGSAEKGVQNLLLAVSLIKHKYPDIKVLIPGNYNISPNGTLIPSKNNGYERVLYNLIEQYNLKENVVFTGRLGVREMAESISHSHIFVNPSCMEVHALSLREAMCMGVPCISSLCGSSEDYIQHNCNGLIYRYEEYELLALYIDKLFSNKELCEKYSNSAVNVKDEYQICRSINLNGIYINISKRGV